MKIEDQLPALFDALKFAADKHQYQRRGGYDPLPYINHLIKVTEAMIRVGRETDGDLLLATILHDVIEDTDATRQELAERYGQKVADTVWELTDDMSLPYAERKRRQIEKATALSTDARKVRIADKASNIRDIVSYPIDWPHNKKIGYIDNSIQVVDRIRGVNPRLEAWFDEEVKHAMKALGQHAPAKGK
jgi:(p)ppGpp synthase/HD superfamily hydrolase